MAEVLAHNSSSVAQELAQSIYLALWEEYSQPYYQQDVVLAKWNDDQIISSLITQIGASAVSYSSVTNSEEPSSSVGHEVTTALAVLKTLAQNDKNIADLRKYRIFIRGVLDYAERLNSSQINTLLDILCQLSLNDSSGLDELFILTRKYLGMNDLHYKRMGILGVCAIIQYDQGDDEVRILFISHIECSIHVSVLFEVNT